jgi:hypothetical protein
MSDAKAMAIYQSHLDIVSQAFWERDWDTICDHLAPRNSLRTLDAAYATQNHTEMRMSYQSLRNSIEIAGAQAYHRICLEADFECDAGTRIIGRHRTYVLSGRTSVLPPYESDMTLELKDHRWIGVAIFGRFKNTDLTAISPDLLKKRGHPEEDQSGDMSCPS